MKPLSLGFRLLVWALVLSVPLAGVWVASSMAALLNGPRWLTVLGGALLFPLLPLAWDLWAAWMAARRAAKQRSSSSFFSDLDRSGRPSLLFADRLLLRTLALNLCFLGGLVYWSPQTATSALTARGDWPLDEAKGDWVPALRVGVLSLADRLYRLARIDGPDPYAGLQETVTPPPPPAIPSMKPPPAPIPTLEETPVVGPAPSGEPPGKPEPAVASAGRPSGFDGPVELRLNARYYNSGGEPEALALRLRAQGELKEGEIVAADPGKPTRMLLLGPPVVAREQVRAVEHSPPFMRVVLDPVGTTALCAATGPGADTKRLVVLFDGVARGQIRADERLCDGVVSIPIEGSLEADAESTVDQRRQAAEGLWTIEQSPLPELAALTRSDEVSIASVGQFLNRHFPNPALRLRAVHDYVATRVAYDVVSLDDAKRAAQDADTVFRTRKGVCAGYSNLMVALGRVTDLEIVYLSGHSRADDGEISGGGHAWNAARVGESWVLIDATWDAGSVGEDGFKADYSTEYFATPPGSFVVSHLPKVPGWQLAATPITRGEFTRLPMLRPSFYAAGLALRTPDRSQVDADDSVVITVDNPHGRKLMAEVRDDGLRTRCEASGDKLVTFTCRFQKPGAYRVVLFAGDDGARSYKGVGGIFVNARG